MRGSQDYQIRTVMEQVRSICTSKHDAKEAAREHGAGNFHEIGKEVGCHSYSTYDDYRAYMKDMATFIRNEYGERDATKIQSYQVEAWLRDKVENGGRQETGVVRATFDTYASAVEKFEQALNKHSAATESGRTYQFDLKAVREYAHDQLGPKNTTSRAYQDVNALVNHIENNAPEHVAHMARMIHETGLRIEGVTFIKPEQLLGYGLNPITGKECGIVHAYGKGGTERDTYPSVKTYDAQVKISVAQAVMVFKKGGDTEKYAKTLQRGLRIAVQAAAKVTGQKHESIHGMRWSWAQRNHALLQQPVPGFREALTYSAALTFISEALFHERSKITVHYLR